MRPASLKPGNETNRGRPFSAAVFLDRSPSGDIKIPRTATCVAAFPNSILSKRRHQCPAGVTSRLLSVRRIKEKHAQRNRGCKIRSGNLQMNGSTKPSDTPSLPATRYRLLKMFAEASLRKVQRRIG